MQRRPGTMPENPHRWADNRALLEDWRQEFVYGSAFPYFELTALKWTPLFHFAFEAGVEVAQTGVDAFLESGELVAMGAVQHLLFDEAPQPFDQVQVGGIGWQVKEFDPHRLGLVKDGLAFLVTGVVQNQCNGEPRADVTDGNLVQLGVGYQSRWPKSWNLCQAWL